MQQRHPNTHTPLHLHAYIYIHTPVSGGGSFFILHYIHLHTYNILDYTGMILYYIRCLLRVLSQISALTLTYFDLRSCKPSIYATSFKKCADVVKYALFFYSLFSNNNCFISSVVNCCIGLEVDTLVLA